MSWDRIFAWAAISIGLSIDVAICIASLVAARHPSFRIVFYVFAVGAALAALKSALVILFFPKFFAIELPSEDLYRTILVWQPLPGVVASILFVIGFFMLVRRVLKLSPNSNAA